MIVEYEAVDRSGKSVSDTLEATDLRGAMTSLRQRDLIVTRVAEQDQRGSGKTIAKRTKRAARGNSLIQQQAVGDASNVRISGKELSLLTRQMAMLLTSGSAVVPALSSVSRQFTKPKPQQMMRRLCADLEEGKPLAESLGGFPSVFGTSYCAIIAAGEASGTLAEMFTRLAGIVGKHRAMRNKIVGALVYPALLSALSIGIVNTLLFFVMPRFGDMFKTLGVDLPGSTKMLLEVATFARARAIIIGVLALLFAGAAVFGLMSSRGRAWLSNAMTYIPVVRGLIRGLLLGETFRVLGMLVEARVGFLDALELVKGVTRNERFQNLYAAMESEVTSGGEISRALESSTMVPPYICHAVHTGEESGNLGTAMSYVADVLDEDNTELLNAMTRLFEPMILIVMGFVVGSVAISLFLPMFDVTSALS